MPNWIKALVRHNEKVPLPEGVVSHVEVLHDDWCDQLSGSHCNCNPDILTGPLIDKRYGGGDT